MGEIDSCLFRKAPSHLRTNIGTAGKWERGRKHKFVRGSGGSEGEGKALGHKTAIILLLSLSVLLEALSRVLPSLSLLFPCIASFLLPKM